MNTDIRALAIRFADLWAVDPHQMVDEIYAADIVMENMANPARFIDGGAQLHAIEDELAARIPHHRHELVRVIAGDDIACLETTVVAPVSGEYAPACVWWWIDHHGTVAAEVGWFDWTVRSTDSRTSHGTVPPSRRAGTPHDAGWYQRAAEQYTRLWTTDPTGAALERFAPGCTFGLVGMPEGLGVDELARARAGQLEQLPRRDRSMTLHQVLGEGASLAMLVEIDDGRRVTRGTVVLTFDDDDLVLSERSYWDWCKSVERGGAATRLAIGSPGWTFDGR